MNKEERTSLIKVLFLVIGFFILVYLNTTFFEYRDLDMYKEMDSASCLDHMDICKEHYKETVCYQIVADYRITKSNNCRDLNKDIHISGDR